MKKGALVLAFLAAAAMLSCGGPVDSRGPQVNESVRGPVTVQVNATRVRRRVTRKILGQAVFYSWQAYAWDFARHRPNPDLIPILKDLNLGLLGHYPGVGVVTHDFHWKYVIGPLARRRDPTPHSKIFDTPRQLEFGPDEYGRLVEYVRQKTGLPVEGSIQVNIVNGTAQEAADWVEYMNAPNDGSNPGGGVDWAAVRAANGHPEPYRIKYWELGNEPHYTAAKIGHLTARQYIRRIRRFVPLMKQRDPSIKVMAYVNPFLIGDPSKLGTATKDVPAESVSPRMTWTQAVIRYAGEYLDYLYFHWYGAWNDRRSKYLFLASSMRFGLIPWLDRLMTDVDRFAPDEATRERLHHIFIPEWNVYGGWARPLALGTAIRGAIAYSRTLNIFAARPEIEGAQHLGLLAPYPKPKMWRGWLLDIRKGYFLLRTKDNGSRILTTAQGQVARLWGRALQPECLYTFIVNRPTFRNGYPSLDATAFRSVDGRKVNVILTNASLSPVDVWIECSGFRPRKQGRLLMVLGRSLDDNNDWDHPNRVGLKSRSLEVHGKRFKISVPAHAVEAVFLEGS